MLPDLNLHETLVAVRSLTKDLTNIIGLFEKNLQAWFRVTRRINQKREVQKLGKILNYMTRLNYEQRSIPGSLRAFADDIERTLSKRKDDRLDGLFYQESHLQGAIEHILDGIIQLREYLEHNQPSLLERNPEIYDKIIESLYAREEIYRKFYSVISPGDPSQLTEEHPKVLRELASEYEKLIKLLTQYRKLVASLLKKVDK